MKKIASYILFFFSVCDVFSQRTNDSLKIKLKAIQPYHVVLKTNPLNMLVGCIPFTSEYKVQNEYTILPHQSVQFGISYLGKGLLLKMAENAANRRPKNKSEINYYAKGFNIQYAHRFYLNNKKNESSNQYAPFGFYCGPMISFARAKIGIKNNTLSNNYIMASNIQICWMGGYQNSLSDRFIFDVYLGMGYKNNQLTEYNSRRGRKTLPIKDVPFYGNNFKLILGVSLGFAFK